MYPLPLKMKLFFASLLCTAFAAEPLKELEMKEYVDYWFKNFETRHVSTAEASLFSLLPKETLKKVVAQH